MMKAQITNGRATYGRTVKTGDYENKKAEVDLSFGLEGVTDIEAAIDEVNQLAERKCHEMLGVQKRVAHAAPAAPAVQAAASGAGDKAALAAAVIGEPTKQTRAKKPPAAPKEEPPKPAADDLGEDLTQAPKTDDSESLDDITTAAPAEITDADLQDKVTKRNGVIKNPQAIRGLIGQYVTHPKGLKDIPKELRAKFLTELEVLPAKAA